MRKLSIGFSKPKSKLAILSPIIRWFEGVPFSHVYVQFYSEHLERNLVYQASKTMVNFVGQIEFEKHVDVVVQYHFEVSDQTYKTIMQFAIDNAGKPYGSAQLVGMGLCRLVKIIFNKDIKNPFGDGNKSYVCAELVSHILQLFTKITCKTEIDNLGLKEIYQSTKEAVQ